VAVKDSSSPLVIAALVLAAGVGGFFWWQYQQKPAPVPAPTAPARPRDAAPPPPPPPPEVAAPPPIQHPVRPSGGKLPPLDEADPFIRKALTDLLGRKGVASFLGLDSFARHFVATVDNLANEQAPPRLWPVNPMKGRFEVEPSGDGTVVSGRNAARYELFVRFAEAVDVRKAVAVYLRLYPLFQQAYQELGYPDRYFNDRVIHVINHLLATPTASGPVKVKLVEVQGATRPLYQFADPAMEARTAGQKILLRMGQVHADRLKAKLQEARDEIISSPVVRRKKRR
jgi:hypothetical protein